MLLCSGGINELILFCTNHLAPRYAVIQSIKSIKCHKFIKRCAADVHEQTNKPREANTEKKNTHSSV